MLCTLKYNGESRFLLPSPFGEGSGERLYWVCFRLLFPHSALSNTPGNLTNCSPSPFGEGWGEAVFFPLSLRRGTGRGCSGICSGFPPTLSYPMNSIPTWKTMALTTQARSVVYPAANKAQPQLPVSPLMAAMVAMQGK